jgi:hypothetical protein
MARPLLALGGIVLIGVGVAIGFGWWTPATAEADAQLSAPVKSVRLDTDSGSVHLRVGQGQGKIHQTFSYRGGKPGDGYRMDGDELVLDGCGSRCDVSYEIVLPEGVPVKGKSDSGDLEFSAATSVDVSSSSGRVEVRDVPGEVKIKTESGRIELVNIGQAVEAKVESGSIEGSGLRGGVDAQTSSGSIKLALQAANDVTAKTDSGSIELTVPSGPYRVEGSSDSGHRDIGVAQDSSSAQTLDLKTDSGSVTVRAA